MALPSQIGNFYLAETRKMADFEGAMAYLFIHSEHKCKFLVLSNPGDSHSYTSICFRTPTTDDSGANHALEHLVCMQCEKYDSGNVWEEMYERSFATDANVYTTQTNTLFSFATTNEKSLQQSLPVVVELVFNGTFDERDFLNEVHRMEVDGDTLKHNGVVYNEVLSDMYNRTEFFTCQIMKALFPDCAGGFDMSGADGGVDKLTWKGLQELYRKNYAPSNAFFGHYGTGKDAVSVVKLVSDTIDKIPFVESVRDLSIYKQPRWCEPRVITVPCPAIDDSEPMEEQFAVIIAWYVGNGWDTELIWDLSFLESLLVFSNHSPMYQAVIASGLADEFVCTGMDEESGPGAFMIGVDGVNKDSVDKVIEVIHETLRSIVAEGFSNERRQAILNRYALDAVTPTANVGEELLEEVSANSVFDVDVFVGLDAMMQVDKIGEKNAPGLRYWEKLIQELLIDNKHRLTSIMVPHEGFVKKAGMEITARLRERMELMSEEERKALERQEALFQNDESSAEESERECLAIPEFNKGDIRKDVDLLEPDVVDGNIGAFIVPTRGLCFFRIQARVHVNSEDLNYMRTLLRVWGKVGAGDRDELELGMFVDTYSSGFSFDMDDPEDTICTSDDAPSLLSVSIACREEFCDQTLSILEDIMFRPRLDNPKVIGLELGRDLNNSRSNITSGVSELLSISQVGFSTLINQREIAFGYSAMNFMEKIVETGDFAKLATNLASFFDRMMRCATFKGTVHCSSRDRVDTVTGKMKTMVTALNERGSSIPPPPSRALKMPCSDRIYIRNTGSTTSSVVVSIFLKSLPVEKAMPFYILSKVLSDVLYEPLRETLGVYAFYGAYTESECCFWIATECDPRPEASITSMKNAIDSIVDGDIGDDIIDHALVRVFADMDAPESPQDRGYDEFLRGHTKEYFQRRRDLLMGTNREHVVESAKYIKTCEWHYAIMSNESVAAVPDGYEVIDMSDVATRNSGVVQNA